jgi:hypothetical protein
VKIRLWATEAECRAAAERLMRTPGLIVVSVSEPYPDRGASVLVRVFVEARLEPPPETGYVTATAGGRPPRPDQRASALAQRMTSGKRRRTLPAGGATR